MKLVLEGFLPPRLRVGRKWVSPVRVLGPNGGTYHWAIRHAVVAWVHQRVWAALQEQDAITPLSPPVRLRARFVFPTARKRDVDNWTTILKPVVDALVKAGVLIDDNADLLWLDYIVLEVVRKERRLELDLEEEDVPGV